jgi:hypothetical protein
LQWHVPAMACPTFPTSLFKVCSWTFQSMACCSSPGWQSWSTCEHATAEQNSKVVNARDALSPCSVLSFLCSGIDCPCTAVLLSVCVCERECTSTRPRKEGKNSSRQIRRQEEAEPRTTSLCIEKARHQSTQKANNDESTLLG